MGRASNAAINGNQILNVIKYNILVNSGFRLDDLKSVTKLGHRISIYDGNVDLE